MMMKYSWANIWMILLIGIGVPEFVLANCEGTGPCYCTPGTNVCTNNPPPSHSTGSSGGSSQDMLIQAAGMLGNAAGQALRGNNEEDARRQAEAIRAAELQRQADEARRVERLRQQELAKQRILNSIKGAEPSSSLSIKTEDSESLSNGNELGLKLSDSNKQDSQTDAYNKGFKDATECSSQNAGPYCSGLSEKPWQACLDDYRRGYKVGNKQRVQILEEATAAGETAGAKGELNNAASDDRALGPCRNDWINSYTSGYFRRKNTVINADRPKRSTRKSQ